MPLSTPKHNSKSGTDPSYQANAQYSVDTPLGGVAPKIEKMSYFYIRLTLLSQGGNSNKSLDVLRHNSNISISL